MCEVTSKPVSWQNNWACYGYTKLTYKSTMKTLTDQRTSYNENCALFFREKGTHVNPLRYNSDQRQISLRNINAFSVREVTRIKDMITQHEFRW